MYTLNPNDILKQILVSSSTEDGTVNNTSQILAWVKERNESLMVNIVPNKLSESLFWFYDVEQGCVTNKNHSFFTIQGLVACDNNGLKISQPIIIQDEIGYLGIICKKIDGVLQFLMQAKIEPGNINCIQISPTIQATKSNFTAKHGGAKPAYLDYFINAHKHTVIVDQIQSEQSSRFYKKRNRNIIICVDEEIEILPSHKWMTLGQIKQLMKQDNLVNMDTRTIISCIPFVFADMCSENISQLKCLFRDESLFHSMFSPKLEQLKNIYHYINNYKMFTSQQTTLVSLSQLDNWEMTDDGIYCKSDYSFCVIYCNIEVEGREVRKWTQPLFKAEGLATFGLFTTVIDGTRHFLVKGIPEIGCFDTIELGPTIQREAVHHKEMDQIETLFLNQYSQGQGILHDVILSEEGGRFYHEQNKNIIIEISKKFIGDLPPGYFWASYHTLNMLTQVNNCLNIQLRNLLSLLEV